MMATMLCLALCLPNVQAFGSEQATDSIDEWSPQIRNPNLNTLLFYTCVTPQIGNQCEEGSYRPYTPEAYTAVPKCCSDSILRTWIQMIVYSILSFFGLCAHKRLHVRPSRDHHSWFLIKFYDYRAWPCQEHLIFICGKLLDFSVCALSPEQTCFRVYA